MTETVVVGAGLAGLVAARRLAETGANVTVIERRDEVGGRVRSREVRGFTLDRGFQVLFPNYPAAREELDLDNLSLRRFRPGAVVADRTDGRRSVLSDPLRDPRGAVETLLNREVTVADKLRTLWLQLALRGQSEDDLFARDDRSIRAALRDRGFSDRFVERFAAPFYGGITLDRSLSTSHHVFDYTFRLLSEGRAALPADGMGSIASQLRSRAKGAGATISTGERVELVATEGSETGAVVETERRTVAADAVVVATDPPTASDLTGVDTIPTDGRGSVTQYYRLPAATAPDAGRRIVLNAEDAAPNTVVALSAVAPDYSPAGDALLSATFLRADAFDPFEAADGRLEARTREALSAWFPEYATDGLETVATDRIEFAQFRQPPGFVDRLPSTRAPAGPVYLAGDYTRWSSIQGALRSGRDAATAVVEDR